MSVKCSYGIEAMILAKILYFEARNWNLYGPTLNLSFTHFKLEGHCAALSHHVLTATRILLEIKG
jgi:hypothetical protein